MRDSDVTLMPGLYTVRIWLDINHQEAALVNHAARVSVLESDYYGSGKLLGMGRWRCHTTIGTSKRPAGPLRRGKTYIE